MRVHGVSLYSILLPVPLSRLNLKCEYPGKLNLSSEGGEGIAISHEASGPQHER